MMRRGVGGGWRGREGRVGRGTVRHCVALLMILHRSHHRTKMVGVVTEATGAAESTDAPRDPGGGCQLIFGPESEPVGLGCQIRRDS